MTVAINPTGSATFGQGPRIPLFLFDYLLMTLSKAFTDAILENWGGRPFEDLQKGWSYILKEYPEVSGSQLSTLGTN